MAAFTVFFEAPWWVGILEVEDDEGLRAHRIVFGPEPGWPVILETICRGWNQLRRTPAVPVAIPNRVTAARAQRELARQGREGRPSTKAQEALAASWEAGKEARKERHRRNREAKLAHKEEVAALKAKAKRRGR